MIRSSLFAAATALALAASPVLAQEHQHERPAPEGGEKAGHMMQGMHGGMAGCPMMGGMGGMHGPAMILEASEALGLTDEQTRALTELKDAGEHHHHMQAAMEAHRTAAAALENGAADIDAYAAALEQAADHMVMAHVAMARSALDAKAVLTPEQVEKLDGIMKEMHGEHSEPGEHGGMMQEKKDTGHGGHGGHG